MSDRFRMHTLSMHVCVSLAALCLSLQSLVAQGCSWTPNSSMCTPSGAVRQTHAELCPAVNSLLNSGYTMFEKTTIPITAFGNTTPYPAFLLVKSPNYDMLASIDEQNKNLRDQCKQMVTSMLDTFKIEINQLVIETLGKIPGLGITPELSAAISKEVSRAIEEKLAATDPVSKP